MDIPEFVKLDSLVFGALYEALLRDDYRTAEFTQLTIFVLAQKVGPHTATTALFWLGRTVEFLLAQDLRDVPIKNIEPALVDFVRGLQS